MSFIKGFVVDEHWYVIIRTKPFFVYLELYFYIIIFYGISGSGPSVKAGLMEWPG